MTQADSTLQQQAVLLMVCSITACCLSSTALGTGTLLGAHVSNPGSLRAVPPHGFAVDTCCSTCWVHPEESADTSDDSIIATGTVTFLTNWLSSSGGKAQLYAAFTLASAS